MAIKANLILEGFRLEQAYCRIVTAEIRRAEGGLICDCVVDVLSAATARAPIRKRSFQNIAITDGAGVGVRRQLYDELKQLAMFADAEDV